MVLHAFLIFESKGPFKFILCLDLEFFKSCPGCNAFLLVCDRFLLQWEFRNGNNIRKIFVSARLHWMWMNIFSPNKHPSVIYIKWVVYTKNKLVTLIFHSSGGWLDQATSGVNKTKSPKVKQKLRKGYFSSLFALSAWCRCQRFFSCSQKTSKEQFPLRSRFL